MQPVAPQVIQRLASGTVWAQSQAQVHQTAVTQLADKTVGGGDLQAGSAVPGAQAVQPCGQTIEDFPVVEGSFRLGHERWRELHHVAHRHGLEDGIKLGMLQLAGGRQDDIGVAGGFVDVEVDADHEIQLSQGLVQLAAIRAGQHRITGMGHKGFHLPLARGEHFIGQGGHREFATEFRVSVDPAAVAIETAGVAAEGTQGHDIEGGPGEHDTAFPVQVAGEDVDEIDQPGAEGAVGTGGDAHPGVDSRTGSRGDVAGQLANDTRGHAHGLGHFFRCPVHHQAGQVLFAIEYGVQLAGRHQQLLEQHLGNGQQQVHIGTGADKMVLVGHFGGLGAARIDDHHLAPAFLQGLEAPFHVRHGHDGTVGGQRVTADDQEVIGAVHIRDGKQGLVAE